MELAEFLAARLDEDEAAAHRAGGGGPLASWEVQPAEPEDNLGMPTSAWVAPEGHEWTVAQVMDREFATHIARWDPARVLADVAAKRELIKSVMAWGHDYHDDDTWFSCSQALLPAGQRTDPEDSEPGSGCSDDSRRGQPCDCGLDRRRNVILIPLAAPYADHPDYDPAWKIDG